MCSYTRIWWSFWPKSRENTQQWHISKGTLCSVSATDLPQLVLCLQGCLKTSQDLKHKQEKHCWEQRITIFSSTSKREQKWKKHTHRTQHKKRLNQTKKDSMWCFSCHSFFIKPCQYQPIGENKTVKLSRAVKPNQQNWASVRSFNLLALSMSIYVLPRSI